MASYCVFHLADSCVTLHGACMFTCGDTKALFLYSAVESVLLNVCVCVCVCVSVCLCVWSVAHSCPALCDLTDCRPAGSSVHGISQARVLEWVATSSSRSSSRPRDQIDISRICHTGRRFLYHSTTWEGHAIECISPVLLAGLLWMNFCVISEFWLQLSSKGLSLCRWEFLSDVHTDVPCWWRAAQTGFR